LDRGGPIEIELLKANTERATEKHFLKIADQLKAFCAGSYKLKADYSKVDVLHAMGYKSSFYYFCWDIYLSFDLKTEKGDVFLLVAQLSDQTPGNKHNVSRFHVLRVYIFDDKGTKMKQIENAG